MANIPEISMDRSNVSNEELAPMNSNPKRVSRQSAKFSFHTTFCRPEQAKQKLIDALEAAIESEHKHFVYPEFLQISSTGIETRIGHQALSPCANLRQNSSTRTEESQTHLRARSA